MWVKKNILHIFISRNFIKDTITMKINTKLFNSKEDNTNNKQKLKISDFKSIQQFWEFVTQNNEWYLEFIPQDFEDIESNSEILIPFIIKTTNDLRYNLNFKQDNYWNIMQWDNIVFQMNMDDKLKQFCSNCKKEIDINHRYPRLICQECTKKLTSSDGRKVEFFNTYGLGYGCQGYYSNTNKTEKYNSNECYIGNKTFIAEEGRFGGIVIELKE